MTFHCFVPDDFGVGVMIIPYRMLITTVWITFSPVVSKLFEYCILDAAMTTSDVQFGF